MKTDENWKQVRLLSKDLETLLDLPLKEIEEYNEVFQDLIIHKFIEDVSKEDDPRGLDYEIILPYIGSLIISISDKGKISSTNFVCRPAFFHDLRKAYNSLESPLVKRYSKILGKTLVDKYNEENGND